MATKSKYAIDPKNPYAGLAGMAEKSDKAATEAADFSYLATALPVILKEAFNKKKDPALDAAIVEKGQQVMGGAIEGLNKFKDISDPFTRRALAEKYQGGLSIGYGALTSERDRRQGKFEEYITKWGGLYGAEAARKQAQATIQQNQFSTYKSLADTAEDTRRYNIEQAEKKANKGTTEANKYNTRLMAIADEVRQGKYSRETAAKIIEKEFGAGKGNDIYTVVEDNYEKTPYSASYFTPKAAELSVSEKQTQERQALVAKLRGMGYSDKEIEKELKLQGY